VRMTKKFRASIDQSTFEVSFTEGGVMLVDGSQSLYDIVPLPSGAFSLLLDGQSIVVREVPTTGNGDENGITSGRTTVLISGKEFTVTIDDDRSLLLKSVIGRKTEKKNATTVSAPMPGMVTQVQVKEGDSVEAGAGLLILEAMKMENEVRSPVSGIIRSVYITQGKPVEKGFTLVTIVERL
jgi:biotin carboxyl carrier protein